MTFVQDHEDGGQQSAVPAGSGRLARHVDLPGALPPVDSIVAQRATAADPVKNESSDPAGGDARFGVDPTMLHHVGKDVDNLRSSIAVGAVDRNLLTAETLGHAGLADALRSFVTCWDQRLGEFAEHLEILGEVVADADRRYLAADRTSAEPFADSDRRGPLPDVNSLGKRQ